MASVEPTTSSASCAGHIHRPEVAAGASDAGAVVLEIGPGAAATIVRTTRAMCGQELEIRPVGQDWTGRHVSVRQRNGTVKPQFAAIFGGLTAGRYELRVRGSETGPLLAVDVPDAAVTTADWPDGFPG